VSPFLPAISALARRSPPADALAADTLAADAGGPARRAAADRRSRLAAQPGGTGARAAGWRAARGRRGAMKGPGAARRPASAAPSGSAAGDESAPPGLVWVSDATPGIRRIRVADGFVYRGVDGKRIRRAAELRRIRALAIPPAYEDVWICSRANGHLQATGRDARGRKQYRYHPDWRLAKDADKFERMLEFGAALARIRKRVKVDLAGPVGSTPGREAVLATIVRLLDTTYARIGNEEYARANRSFGLTTLRNRHAAVSGTRLFLRFRGKSGKEHEVALDDPRVARVVRRCQAMPGQDLFQYLDDAGDAHVVGSADVNDYIRAVSGADFTAKDFRTWHGSVHALELWAGQGAEPERRLSAKELLAEVAKRLGNTIAVCKKSYVHPRVLELLATAPDAPLLTEFESVARRAGLSAAERRLLAFLARR
jgi:DNA topoisomerase-1